MKIALLTLALSFFLVVPFLSTPIGEQLYYSYQETSLHKAIYCKYVDIFGAKGFSKLKFVLKCKL